MEEKKQIQSGEGSVDISSFSDIKLRIHVEVGRTRKNFAELLKIKEGDIIKLDKSLEEYIDLYINDKLFAIGELVVVNDKYGIRIVDLA